MFAKKNSVILSVFVVAAVVIIPTAQASTKKNADNYIAQQIAQAYTGRADETVDARIGEAVGAIAGCQIGEFFLTGGLDQAAELARSSAKAQGLVIPEMAIQRAQKSASKMINENSQKSCKKSEWPKKFGQSNLSAARLILSNLDPVLKANRDSLIRGDFGRVGEAILGEGTKIHGIVKNVGKLKFDTAEAHAFAEQIRDFGTDDLLRMASSLKKGYEIACDPNSLYRVAKRAEKIRNAASNALEMTISPMETLVEIAIEKILGGDGSGKLMQDESVAISRYDAAETHDHLQHENQNSACFSTEARYELVNRQLRGIAVGQIDQSITPQEMRGMYADGRGAKRGMIYDVQPSAENARKRDQFVKGAL